MTRDVNVEYSWISVMIAAYSGSVVIQRMMESVRRQTDPKWILECWNNRLFPVAEIG